MFLQCQHCGSHPHSTPFSQGWAASPSLQLSLFPLHTHHRFQAASPKLSGGCGSCRELHRGITLESLGC